MNSGIKIVENKPSKNLRVPKIGISVFLFVLMLLVSCSAVFMKLKTPEVQIQEVIVVDTVVVEVWKTAKDVTPVKLSPKKQTQMKSNLSLVLEKKSKGEKLEEWDQFRLSVWNISVKLKHDFPEISGTDIQIYDWTMKLLWHESRFNSKARNKASNAQGLFQVMPFVAKELKFPKNLKDLHWSKQLVYYNIYIRFWLKQVNTKKINSAGDWYMLGLYPAYADDDDSFVFGSKNGNRIKRMNYNQNRGLDFNKDGIITKGEVEQKLLSHFK